MFVFGMIGFDRLINKKIENCCLLINLLVFVLFVFVYKEKNVNKLVCLNSVGVCFVFYFFLINYMIIVWK